MFESGFIWGGPVNRVSAGVVYNDDIGCWVATGDAARSAFLNPALSSQTVDISYGAYDVHGHHAELISTVRRWMVLLDGDDHRAARLPVQRMFSQERMRRLEGRVRASIGDAIAEVPRDGVFDAVPLLAQRVSATTMIHLLDLTDDVRDRLHGWARALADFLGSPYRQDFGAAAQTALTEMRDYLDGFRTGDESGKPDVATFMLLLFGGLETTASLIGVSLWYILGNGLTTAIAADPAQALAVVERVLDLYAPLRQVIRVAADDVELGGCPVDKDGLVIVLLTGQDPMVEWDNPAQPSPHHGDAPNGHLAFGLGKHFCVGAPLARMEAVQVITMFCERFPEASLVKAEWGDNQTYRGLSRLIIDAGGEH